MKYISFCSGVEAASLAFRPLGWTPVAFSEIEPFPCAVLKARWPHVPNLGDCRNIHYKEGELYVEQDGNKTKNIKCGHIDLAIGGFPCQSFSQAGQRAGLEGPADLFENTSDCYRKSDPIGWFTKMFPECSVQTMDETFATYSSALMTAGIAAAGVCLTFNMCEWTAFPGRYRRDEGVSSLSDILVRGNVPLKYYLTATACRGIINRGEKRGKALPPELLDALNHQIAVLDAKGEETEDAETEENA